MQLKSVVLPAPLGPIKPQIAPRATSKETSSSAVTPPNRIVTPWTASRAEAWRSASPSPPPLPPALRSHGDRHRHPRLRLSPQPAPWTFRSPLSSGPSSQPLVAVLTFPAGLSRGFLARAARRTQRVGAP